MFPLPSPITKIGVRDAVNIFHDPKNDVVLFKSNQKCLFGGRGMGTLKGCVMRGCMAPHPPFFFFFFKKKKKVLFSEPTAGGITPADYQSGRQAVQLLHHGAESESKPGRFISDSIQHLSGAPRL